MKKQEFDIYAYGCTYIPNKIYYSLTISDTSITQYAMCHYILHRTYGNDLDAAPINSDEFALYGAAEDTDTMKKQLQQLIDNRIVLCLEVKPGNIRFYKINPDITQWNDKNLQKLYGTHVWRKLLDNQRIQKKWVDDLMK